MICREIIFFFRFEYHMFYVLYPFVTYLLTLPRPKTGVDISRRGRSGTCRLYLTQNVGQVETGPGKLPTVLSLLLTFYLHLR
jgi:hypothetical protein